jgi:hypothetical protein
MEIVSEIAVGNAFMEDAKDYFTKKEKKYKEIAKLNKSLRK